MNKEQLTSKYKSLLINFDIKKLTLNVSLNTLALMCANIELELLQTCHYKSTEKTTSYIIQNVINSIGVLK